MTMAKLIGSLTGLFVAMGVAITPGAAVASDKVSADCTFKGIRLYGKVRVVTSFPDLKVKIVDAFPDLKVRTVTSFPDSCGKWKFVESFPDFTVQFVESFPDIKIRYVESFPGR